MNKPITPQRLLFAFACLLALERTLSVAGFHYAKQAQRRLQQAFPTGQVHIVGAAWIGVDCGRFRLGDDPAGVTHRFLFDHTAITTDLATEGVQSFDEGFRHCMWLDHSGRGSWQDAIFDAVVLPLV